MATYKDAVWWTAHNDGAGDTPEGMDYQEAFETVRGMISTALVTDIFDKDQDQVTHDILKVRGFKKAK